MGIEYRNSRSVKPCQLSPDKGGGIVGAGFLIHLITGNHKRVYPMLQRGVHRGGKAFPLGSPQPLPQLGPPGKGRV